MINATCIKATQIFYQISWKLRKSPSTQTQETIGSWKYSKNACHTFSSSYEACLIKMPANAKGGQRTYYCMQAHNYNGKNLIKI